MRHRLSLIVLYVGAVLGLAVAVVVGGAAPNTGVYRTGLRSTAVVEGELAGVVRATTLTQDESRRLAGTGEGIVVILTAAAPVDLVGGEITVEGGTRSGMGAALLPLSGGQPEGDTVALAADVPTAVELVLTRNIADREGIDIEIRMTPDGPVDLVVPLRRQGGGEGQVRVTTRPVPVTGEDLGIPGQAGIDEQDLPRPESGEVLATQLADGRPVWVVGLSDDVAVYDARSPHQASGLVGWCGSMPGFIDSIGSSRFDMFGRYRFGPAPTGLVSYQTELTDDRVVVTGRLAAPPRSEVPVEELYQPLPAAEVFADVDGTYCDIDQDKAQAANERQEFVEDYTGDPSWDQHDLADWPAYEGQADGWYRTTSASLPQVGRLRGDLLIRREGGRTVDAASPPGTARYLYAPAPGYRDGSHVGLLRAVGSVEAGEVTLDLQPVVWLTADGIEEVTGAAPPTPEAVFAPLPPGVGPDRYVVAPDVDVPDQPGTLVRVTVTDDLVTRIRVLG